MERDEFAQRMKTVNGWVEYDTPDGHWRTIIFDNGHTIRLPMSDAAWAGQVGLPAGSSSAAITRAVRATLDALEG